MKEEETDTTFLNGLISEPRNYRQAKLQNRRLRYTLALMHTGKFLNYVKLKQAYDIAKKIIK